MKMVHRTPFSFTFLLLLRFKNMQSEDIPEDPEEEIDTDPGGKAKRQKISLGSQNRVYVIQVKFLLVFTCMCLGSFRYIPGATLIDLAVQVRVRLRNMPFIFTARAAGYIVGCIVGIYLVQIISFRKKAILIFLLMVLLSASIFSISQIRNIALLYTVFFASGVSMAGMVAGVKEIHLTLTLNSELGKSFYKVLYAFYSLGSFSSPFLVKGYVKNAVNQTDLSTYILVPDYRSIILFVYLFLCAVTLLVSLLWLANYCFMTNNHIKAHRPEIRKEDLNPIIKRLAISNASILFFLGVTLHFSFIQLLPTYGILAFNMSQYETCNLLILFHGFYSLGSFLMLFQPETIKHFNLQIVGIALVFCGAILMYLYTDIDIVSFWVGHAFIGLGSSALLPTLMAWVNSRIPLHHSKVIPLFTMGAISEMVVPTAMAHYVFNYATLSTSYLFVTCAYIIFLFFQFIWMYLLHPKRKVKTKPNSTQDPVLAEHFLRRYLRRLSQELPFFKDRKESSKPEKETEVEPDQIFSHINEALQRVHSQNSDLLLSMKKMEYSPTALSSQSDTIVWDRKEDERRSVMQMGLSPPPISKSEPNLWERDETVKSPASSA